MLWLAEAGNTCIQLLLIMIEKAESAVQDATIAAPNSRMPKKLASKAKPVKVSYDKSGPWMGPDIRDSSPLLPNRNAMTIPQTTPGLNATPKILYQNLKT